MEEQSANSRTLDDLPQYTVARIAVRSLAQKHFPVVWQAGLTPLCVLVTSDYAFVVYPHSKYYVETTLHTGLLRNRTTQLGYYGGLQVTIVTETLVALLNIRRSYKGKNYLYYRSKECVQMVNELTNLTVPWIVRIDHIRRVYDRRDIEEERDHILEAYHDRQTRRTRQ